VRIDCNELLVMKAVSGKATQKMNVAADSKSVSQGALHLCGEIDPLGRS
jgi:hypothetical protein